jgi:hypothetical protein
VGPFDGCRVYIDVMFVCVGTMGWVLVWLRTQIYIYIYIYISKAHINHLSLVIQLIILFLKK